MTVPSPRGRSELASLLRRWQATSVEVQKLLAGHAWDGGSLDYSRLRTAWDARSEAEEAILTFWSRQKE